MGEDKNKKEIDKISGVETTGHEWDGLKELNNPLPRWWVWIFVITIIWSIGYWIIYPAWPTFSGATKGMSGRTQFVELAESQQEILARQKNYLAAFENATLQDIMKDPQLYAFAIAGGKSAFKDNCATCHGTGAAGGRGYPNLNDDDWLWGGKIDDIHETLLYGIRSGHEDTRVSQMPAFGKDKLLTREEINTVIDYILTLSGSDPKENYQAGLAIYKSQCASCHGPEGKGGRDFGAPNLTDKIWLYGKDRETLYNTIYYSRQGVMPAWINRLDKNTIKQLTIYLHELGGGEKSDESILPDDGLYEDAPLESKEYEKTEPLEPHP